jgi:hypothetical protein
MPSVRRVFWLFCACVLLALPLFAQPEARGNAGRTIPGVVQPDIVLHLTDDSRPVGVHIINRTGRYNGDEQHLAISIPCGTVVPVFLSIANTAEVGGVIGIRLSPLNNDWQCIVVGTGMLDTQNLTEKLTAPAGWSPRVAPRADLTGYMLFTAPARPSTMTVGITAMSPLDPTAADYAEIVLSCTDQPKPPLDLSIRSGIDGVFKGVNLFNRTGVCQSVWQNMPSNLMAIYQVKLTNTSAMAQHCWLEIPILTPLPSGQLVMKGLQWKIFDAPVGGTDVTDRFFDRFGYLVLQAGESAIYRVEVINGTQIQNLQQQLTITAATEDDPGVKYDACVLGIHFIPPAYYPDLSMKLKTDAAYTGEGVNQSRPGNPEEMRAQAFNIPCQVEKTTTVLLRIRNASPKTQAFRFIGPTGYQDILLMQMFDHDGYAITEKLVNRTWTTPELKPNETYDFSMDIVTKRMGPPYTVFFNAAAQAGSGSSDTMYVTFMPTDDPPAAAK